MKKIILAFILMFSFTNLVNAEVEVEIKSTDDVINTIKNIFNTDEINEYILTYDENTYNNLDQEKILNFYKENYMFDLKQNMYKYNEFGLYDKDRYNLNITKTAIIVNNYGKKMSQFESLFVESNTDEFLKPLKNKTDYEKIYNIYKYLNNLEYDQNTYDNSLEANMSVYDVMYKGISSCVGASTAFQYFMEKLGIESYIVDNLFIVDNGYYTTHTYNIVKLNGIWYTVDDYFGGNGLLKKKIDNDYYYDVLISENDYNLIDCKYYLNDKVPTSLNKEEKAEVKNDNGEIEIIVLVLILLIIFLIIIIFTRRKK